MFVSEKRKNNLGGGNAFSREYEVVAVRAGNERKLSITYPHRHPSRVLGLKKWIPHTRHYFKVEIMRTLLPARPSPFTRSKLLRE